MKTMLMLVMSALLLSGCREKTDQAWLKDIHDAARNAAYWHGYANEKEASAADLVDYHFKLQKVQDIKCRAIADGVPEDRIELEEISGQVDGRRQWMENEEKKRAEAEEQEKERQARQKELEKGASERMAAWKAKHDADVEALVKARREASPNEDAD